MTTNQILVAGKAYLLNVGWAQDPRGDYGCAGLPQCALGATEVVGGIAGRGAGAALMVQLSYESIVDWNDAPERTLEEVVDLFDRAILATAPEDTVSLDAELTGVA